MQYPNSPILKDWAEKLVQKYDRELFRGSVVPSAILFIEDTITGAPKEPKSGKKRNTIPRLPKPRNPFEIKAIHPAIAERVDADYMIVYYKLRAVTMDRNKLATYFLETLLRCKGDGKLNQPDLKTFKVVAKGVGIDFADKQFVGVDILEGELLKGTTQQQTLKLEVPKPAEEATDSEAAAPPPGGDANPAAQPPDSWQPPEPYATKDNVIPFQRPTGTDPTA